MFFTIARVSSVGLCGLTALWLSASPSAASDERDATGRPRCQSEDARENCPGRVVLVGYPVEEAKRRALAFGYTGKIEVLTLSEYDARCKAGTVCRVDPKRWEIELDGELTLLVNRKVAISAPQ